MQVEVCDMEDNVFFFQETQNGHLHMIPVPKEEIRVKRHTQGLVPVTIEFLEYIYEGYFMVKDIYMKQEENETISFVLENRILSLQVTIAGNDISVVHSFKNTEK